MINIHPQIDTKTQWVDFNGNPIPPIATVAGTGRKSLKRLILSAGLKNNGKNKSVVVPWYHPGAFTGGPNRGQRRSKYLRKMQARQIEFDARELQRQRWQSSLIRNAGYGAQV